MNEKLKSRKLIFTIIWNLFLVGAMIIDAVVESSNGLAMQVLPWAGGITLGYLGMQGAADAIKARK